MYWVDSVAIFRCRYSILCCKCCNVFGAVSIPSRTFLCFAGVGAAFGILVVLGCVSLLLLCCGACCRCPGSVWATVLISVGCSFWSFVVGTSGTSVSPPLSRVAGALMGAVAGEMTYSPSAGKALSHSKIKSSA